MLCTTTSLKICKRYYPGGQDVGKKIAEKTLNNVTAPCIGAGCAIKSSINKPNTNANNATPVPNTQNIPTQDKTSQNKPQINNPEYPNKDLQKFHNESTKFAKKSSTNNNIQNPVEKEEKTTNTLKENESTPIISILVKEVALNDAIEHLQKYNVPKNDSSTIVDDAVGIPYTPKNNSNHNTVKLKTISGKEYEPLPSYKTSANDYSKKDMEKGMSVRELVKQSETKPMPIKLADDSTYILNNAAQGFKLTDIGNAYSSELKKNTNTSETSTISSEIDKEKKLLIIVPPKPPTIFIIVNGKSKHLLLGYYTINGDFVALGYFTSKNSGQFISDKQYKAFENDKENKTIPKEDKKKPDTQKFVTFDKGNYIKKEDIKPVKYSAEYLATLGEKSSKILEDTAKELSKKPLVNYENTSGYTKEDCFEICKAFDDTAAAIAKNPKGKIKHPISPEQQKLNEENNTKQKDHNKLKKNIQTDHNEFI